MIHSFLDSWPLFAQTYLAAWLLAALLALVGVPIVARDQIFVGAAIGQAAMLGIGLALWLGHLPVAFFRDSTWLTNTWTLTALAIVFAWLTTLPTMAGGDAGQTPEGRTGWVYLLASSLAIVLLAHTPVGQREIDQRLSSAVIGASTLDVAAIGALLLAVGAATLVCHRSLTLVVIDRSMAQANGLRVRAWETVLALVIGLVIGLALRMAGLLFTFGCLVLPTLCARHVCREIRHLYVAGPLLATGTAILAAILGNHLDLPLGPLSVALLALFLPIGCLFGRLRKG